VADIQEKAVGNTSQFIRANDYKGTIDTWKSELNGVLTRVCPVVLTRLLLQSFRNVSSSTTFFHLISTGATYCGSKVKIVRNLRPPRFAQVPVVCHAACGLGVWVFWREIYPLVLSRIPQRSVVPCPTQCWRLPSPSTALAFSNSPCTTLVSIPKRDSK